MDEKLYKKIKSIGAGNIVFGIISVVCGVTTGVLLIVNGARLLAHKCYHISRNIGKHRRQTKLPEVINKPLDFFKWYKIIPVRA